ncbi:hypothetical protein [Methylobacterium sp. CM6257]
MAERRSNQNGQHGGPGLPMVYGVIGSTGLMLAALTMLMAAQMLNSHLAIGHAVDASALPDSAMGARKISSSLQPAVRSTNT